MSIPARKVATITLIVSLVGVAAAFGFKTLTSKEVIDSLEAETTYGPIKLVMELDKNTYSLGENVNINVTITNISNETVLLFYASPPKVDYAIYDNLSRMIATYSSIYGFIKCLADIVLAPSATYSQTIIWEQQRDQNHELQPVDSGTYYITGGTGRCLRYLGPEDEWNENYGPTQTIIIETPKIKIQILHA